MTHKCCLIYVDIPFPLLCRQKGYMQQLTENFTIHKSNFSVHLLKWCWLKTTLLPCNVPYHGHPMIFPIIMANTSTRKPMQRCSANKHANCALQHDCQSNSRTLIGRKFVKKKLQVVTVACLRQQHNLITLRLWHLANVIEICDS